MNTRSLGSRSLIWVLIGIDTTAARQAPHLRQLRHLASSPGSVAPAVPPARLAGCLSVAARPVRPYPPTHAHVARLSLRSAVFLAVPQNAQAALGKDRAQPARLLGRLTAFRAQGRGNVCGGGRKKRFMSLARPPPFSVRAAPMLLLSFASFRGSRRSKKMAPFTPSRVLAPFCCLGFVLTAARWLLSRRRGAV